MPSVTTVLINPSSLYSEGLIRILSGTAFQIAHAVRTPDCVLADQASDLERLFIIGGRDVSDVAKYVSAIANRFNPARIVVIGDRVEIRGAILALQAGAHGYLGDNMSASALVKSLELVMLDEMVLPAEFVRWLPTQLIPLQETPVVSDAVDSQKESKSPLLSSREVSILKKLTAGSSNKVIAYDLAITEATVKVHVKSILRKIHARNRTQAAIWAITNWADLLQAPKVAA
jgi:two-component system nitrate/nitrite response regulator NarL